MELQLIRQRIYDLRGQSVMLDFDLADLYEVETRVLNQAVKRNLTRFPEDFMFQLEADEWEPLRSTLLKAESMSSQIVMSSRKKRGKSYLPFAFTEQGVAMLSSVLRSEKAIQVNIAIMRAFVEFRRYARTYAELSQKIAELEAEFKKEFKDIHEVLKWLGEENQARYDEIAALQQEYQPPVDWPNRRRIGFKKDTESA